MNQDHNLANEIDDDDFFEDIPSELCDDLTTFSGISSSVLTSTTVMHDILDEQQMSFLCPAETLSIRNNGHIEDNCNEDKQQHIISDTSEEWLPHVASTPLTTIPTTSIHRSEREIENEFFQNIENLVRKFLDQPYSQYPYYRVIRLTVDEQTKSEYTITIVINRPTLIFQQ